MKRLTHHLSAAAIVLFAFLCIASGFFFFGRQAEEKLFFALQIEDQGLVVARPKLLGAEGQQVSMRLVDPDDPSQTRVAVALASKRFGDGYQVQLDVALNGSDQHSLGTVSLHHGESRRIELAGASGPVSVQLLVMRVDSPEFEAYMQLARKALIESTT